MARPGGDSAGFVVGLSGSTETGNLSVRIQRYPVTPGSSTHITLPWATSKLHVVKKTSELSVLAQDLNLPVAGVLYISVEEAVGPDRDGALFLTFEELRKEAKLSGAHDLVFHVQDSYAPSPVKLEMRPPGTVRCRAPP